MRVKWTDGVNPSAQYADTQDGWARVMRAPSGRWLWRVAARDTDGPEPVAGSAPTLEAAKRAAAAILRTLR